VKVGDLPHAYWGNLKENYEARIETTKASTRHSESVTEDRFALALN